MQVQVHAAVKYIVLDCAAIQLRAASLLWAKTSWWRRRHCTGAWRRDCAAATRRGAGGRRSCSLQALTAGAVLVAGGRCEFSWRESSGVLVAGGRCSRECSSRVVGGSGGDGDGGAVVVVVVAVVVVVVALALRLHGASSALLLRLPCARAVLGLRLRAASFTLAFRLRRAWHSARHPPLHPLPCLPPCPPPRPPLRPPPRPSPRQQPHPPQCTRLRARRNACCSARRRACRRARRARCCDRLLQRPLPRCRRRNWRRYSCCRHRGRRCRCSTLKLPLLPPPPLRLPPTRRHCGECFSPAHMANARSQHLRRMHIDIRRPSDLHAIASDSPQIFSRSPVGLQN